MTHKKQWLQRALCFLVVLPLTACGSGSNTADALTEGINAVTSVVENSGYAESDGAGGYAMSFCGNVFEETDSPAEGISVSTGTIAEGYVGIKVEDAQRVIVQMIHDDVKYNFVVPTDGTVCYLPLTSGSGTYQLLFMENTSDNKYFQLASETLEVSLQDEFGPFLHSSLMVRFTEDSACVAKAEELAEKATDELDFVKRVYSYVAEHLSYDNELAATVGDGYIPDPDSTFESETGICFDIASLTAAMLRSQGIPTKLITGYVGDEGLYHAWNYFYIEEQGWISVEVKADSDEWNRVDLTYAVSGGDLDGTYVDRYIY